MPPYVLPAVFILSLSVGLSRGLCSHAGSDYEEYIHSYIAVVHGVGVCEYARGCSPACEAAHVVLRENVCFEEYMNLHSYMCPSFRDVGERCGSDLDRHCEGPGAPQSSAQIYIIPY